MSVIVNNRVRVNVYQNNNILQYYIEDGNFKLSDSLLSVFISESKKPSSEGVKTYPFDIIIHSAKDILRGQPSNEDDAYSFGQESLLTNKKPKEKKIPIIHLSMTDAFVESMYILDQPISLPTDVPRAYQIMNNSIWNYLIPICDKLSICGIHYSCQENFERVVKKICENYEKGLYGLHVAKEYADLNARIVTQSFLSGSHASGVSPFIFHSEDVIESLINKEIKEKEICFDLIKKLNWRFLLVDDKASEDMESDDDVVIDNSNGLPWNCKLTILNNTMSALLGRCIDYRKYGENKKIKENTKVLIDYVECLDDAIIALQQNKYDIILLDYLLNEKTKGTKYGYDLLNFIYLDKKESSEDEFYSYKNGPNKHFFFMFISAYSDAVFQRLLSDGLNMSEKYWFVSTGACPTNTPQLFLYNLLKLMTKRIDDAGINRLSTHRILSIVNEIYGSDNVRKNANERYQNILSLQYHYRSILRDVEIPFKTDASIFDTRESVLMTDFIMDKVNLGGMLEHLTQLVHLTAFGTIRQWPEMWEEYVYFKALFEKQLDNVSEKDYIEMCQRIEKYILKLKSQQQ